LFIRITIMQFAFKTKSIKIEIFSLEDLEIFNLIKTIFFLIFLISFFLKLQLLRLLFFVLFFVAFLIFALFFATFFFVASLLNLSSKNMLSLFSSLLDSCLETKSLRKIVNFVDLSIAILSLFLTKILYLFLTR